MMLFYALGYLLVMGTGIWGINGYPSAGASRSSTSCGGSASARRHVDLGDPLALRQEWRTSINRFAEAMTLFAVANEPASFPLMHTGRPWLGYWLTPYPNTMGLWPQFRSPLVWDVFAVSTYATVSALFLVHRPDSRPGERSATARRTARRRSSTAFSRWLARLGGPLAPLRDRYLLLAGPGDAARALRAHGRVVRLRDRHRAGLALDRSSRRTSSPARSTPASRWCC